MLTKEASPLQCVIGGGMPTTGKKSQVETPASTEKEISHSDRNVVSVYGFILIVCRIFQKNTSPNNSLINKLFVFYNIISNFMRSCQIILLNLMLFLACSIYVQEEDGNTIYHGKKYIALNLHSLRRYQRRTQKEQGRLLSKLSKQERKLLTKLSRKDSLAYAALKDNPLTYGSIRTQLKADSATKTAKARNKTRNLKNLSLLALIQKGLRYVNHTRLLHPIS